ncbi:hypothetical protein DPMN_042500 [Dreissena polymorpha]|uniref:Uncharacterized protein n=1 Tax=Dreissena polymorpha TaxID=45954 RepID=A0A9D4HWZ0_DREPO|nr:hypothetical protein DPMN_042500 [Dreissena polymorpha]
MLDNCLFCIAIILSSLQKGCRRFCDLYRSMNTASRLSLLCHIAESYGVDQRAIVDVAQKVL